MRLHAQGRRKGDLIHHNSSGSQTNRKTERAQARSGARKQVTQVPCYTHKRTTTSLASLHHDEFQEATCGRHSCHSNCGGGDFHCCCFVVAVRRIAQKQWCLFFAWKFNLPCIMEEEVIRRKDYLSNADSRESEINFVS
jgi:hypothetical protein